MAAKAGFAPILTPDDANLADNQQPRIKAVSGMLIGLSTVVVMLRFAARRISRAGLWWDDWTILAALIISWGPSISMLISLEHGFGKHIEVELDVKKRIQTAQTWFKLLYAFSTLYTFAITLAKYSILLFYSRIFKEKRFLIALRTVFTVVTLWFIAIQVVVFAECVPINALWNPSVEGTCVDFVTFYQGSGIPNVIFNVIILALPLPMIWSLEIEKKHKLALSGVFLLGSFVVIVSIIRLVYLADVAHDDVTWTYVDAGIWTSVEPSIAVVSASLPILRSLWIVNRRRKASRRATNSASDNDTKIPPLQPFNTHNVTPRQQRKKEGHSSMSSQQFPLNELPAGVQQHHYGNTVTIYSETPSTKTSGDDYYADLPIMHPAESGMEPPSMQRPQLQAQRSELYG